MPAKITRSRVTPPKPKLHIRLDCRHEYQRSMQIGLVPFHVQTDNLFLTMQHPDVSVLTVSKGGISTMGESPVITSTWTIGGVVQSIEAVSWLFNEADFAEFEKMDIGERTFQFTIGGPKDYNTLYCLHDDEGRGVMREYPAELWAFHFAASRACAYWLLSAEFIDFNYDGSIEGIDESRLGLYKPAKKKALAGIETLNEAARSFILKIIADI
ncbi:hypothetical protein Peetri_00174 [Pseudomonas phage vB_PpuM-Peetri]